jgi:hypothetical protein
MSDSDSPSDRAPRKRRQKDTDRAVYRAAAEKCARFVHSNDFPSERACFPYEVRNGTTVLVVFDTHVFKAGPQVRARLLCRVRQRLDQMGLREVGSAAWPPAGAPDAGHTVVLLLAPWTDDLPDRVIAVYEEELERTYAEMFAD